MSGALLRGSTAQTERFAQAKVGFAGWRVYRWEAADGGGLIVTGCVPDGEYTRGPRKGRPRFSRPVQNTKRIVVVSDIEIHEFLRANEIETGACSRCEGSPGQEWVGWGKDGGSKYLTCSRCNGTGAAP